MTKLKKDISDMEFNIPLNDIRTMDIYLKATALKPTDKEPKKVMFGFKFEPKQTIKKESQQSVEDMIKNGDHLKHYRDFVSGKVASFYTAKKIVEMAGFIAGQFSETKTEKEFQELAVALFNGWSVK